MNTLVVILGPTGVGKTELCLHIAEHFHIPIVNADSRQIFAEIPIGTAAPTPKQLHRVKHYFVGNHHINEYYSASMYEQDVLSILPTLFEDSDLALMTGGSMMYIDAVCNGIDDIPTVDENTREWMKKRLAEEGLKNLVEELRQLDPIHWEEVDKSNPRRVVHALEICHMTGKPYSTFRKHDKKKRPFDILKIGLNRERSELYDRINKRVEQMFKDGLVEEARKMYPYQKENALNTVGFKELFSAFNGDYTLDEAKERIQGNTRKYCRKQLTWFKRDETIQWFHPKQEKDIIQLIQNTIQK